MLEINSTQAAALVCCDTLPFSTRLHSLSQADILIRYLKKSLVVFIC